MERELWKIVYQTLRAVDRNTHQRYVHYRPWEIAAVVLWAALHDRDREWACDVRNWNTYRRPKQLPSPATVSRRTKRLAFEVFLDRVTDRLRGDDPPEWELVIDGKPLPVGRCSKDPDAKGTPLGRGYKLHAIWGTRVLPQAWEVTALREYEGTVAQRLLTQIHGKGFLLADGSYEASRMYDAAADGGYQLLAHPSAQDTGKGHVYQSEHRRTALRLFRDGLGWQLYRWRSSIERKFGNAGSFGGGLGPLPNWVRRLQRVKHWVWCKLVINAARILYRQNHL